MEFTYVFISNMDTLIYRPPTRKFFMTLGCVLAHETAYPTTDAPEISTPLM